MVGRFLGHGSGRMVGVLALAVSVLGFLVPSAQGVTPGAAGPRHGAPAPERHRTALRRVIRVERDFTVGPHSLAANELLACPRHTRLVGGGTSLIGEPSRPATAPTMYTNGPVGDILPGQGQTWASEVANTGPETFTYRQFALCVTSRRAR